MGRWRGFRDSEKRMRNHPILPSVDHSTIARKASEIPLSFHDEQGNEIRVATNLMTISPETIADCYRARWQVELLFRWMKQHLNVTHLFPELG
ncbi:transposase [Marininema mesophilum]|uniref:transposase n=1 Tax=Marininema mesophilum TaxID=1048340 RepID=UPI000B8095B0